VAEAANGALAIAEQSRSPAKVLVVDIIMPEKEGVETIIHMRKQFPDLKIIAMSGGGRVGNVDFLTAAMTYGADRVIRKPFRMAEIVKLVREVLA
jgi:YesN/AraC family two-component response regulator